MTKADLIDEVSRLAELTRKDSEVIVETIFDRRRRQDRDSRLRQFPHAPAQASRWTQPEDRRACGSAGEENPILQAEQRIKRSGEHRRSPGTSAGSGTAAARATIEVF